MFKFGIRLLIILATIVYLYLFPKDAELARNTKYILLMAFAILALTFFVKK